MRKDDTTGEYAISNAAARLAAGTHEGPMNHDTFTGFYQRSAPALRGYLMRISGNAALAEDIMQESYVRFLCAKGCEGGEVNYRRYLYQIATNLMRDHWRRPRSSSIEELPESTFASRNQLARVDSQITLDPALAQLRPRDRQVLWLAYAEGYSHKEIAEITGLRSGSVRLLLFRARRKMARLLREQAAERGNA